MEIFKLFGSIFINTDAAEKSMKSIGKTMEEIGGKVSGFGSKLTKTVTAGITGLGTAAIVSASGFEDAMAKVSTIADESEMSMGDMEKAILDLSSQTGVSAAAVAEDVYNAISAGQKTADAVNFVSSSTKLARAGFAETGQSLDILTTILNAYGMEASEVTRVSDILIQTQNQGKTTVGDLASSMGKVIPTAKAQGVELDALCSAYAVMTANGIATAETTTYLNSMLNELGKQGTSASIAFQNGTGHIKEGGLTMAEAMGKGWCLSDVLSILAEQADASGTSIANMFGSAEAGKAASVLWDKAQQLNSVYGEMGGSAGATDAAFQKLETTSYKAQKAINEAKNTLIDLGGTILEMLIPYLEKGAEKVHEFAEWFKGLDDSTKETIVRIALLAAAVGPLLTILGKGISVVGGVVSIGSKLPGCINDVVKAGKLLGSGTGKVLGLLGTAASFTRGTLLPAIGSVITTVGGGLVSAFSTAASFIGTTLLPAIGSIAGPVLAVVAVIAALVAIGVVLYRNWDDISAWASRAWGAITETVGKAVSGIMGFLQGIVGFMGNNWQGLLALIVNPFAGGFKLLYDNCESFRNFIDGFLGKLQEGFHNLTGSISQKVMELNENVIAKVHEIKENVSNRFSEMKENAISRVEEMKENAVSKIHEMGSRVSSGFQDMKDRAAEKFSDLKEKWTSKFSETREKMVSETTEMKEKVGEKLGELKERAVEKAESLKSSVSQKFTDLKGDVSDRLSEIRQKGVEGFESIRERGAAAVDGLKAFTSQKFAEMGSEVFSKFEDFGSRIAGIFSGAHDVLSGIVDKIKGFMDFEWKFPDIKMPHFDLSWDSSGMLGSIASKIGLPGLPKLDVEWYRDGGIMTDPTAFGVNPASGRLMAGGEAGPEAIAPISLLKEYVREAVAERDGRLYEALSAILELLRECLPGLAGMQVVLDTGVLVGEMAGPMEETLSNTVYMRGRRS